MKREGRNSEEEESFCNFFFLTPLWVSGMGLWHSGESTGLSLNNLSQTKKYRVIAIRVTSVSSSSIPPKKNWKNRTRVRVGFKGERESKRKQTFFKNKTEEHT